jgi:hypothetical protein
MTRTSETTTQAGSSAIGQRIYLDRDQCEFLGASYTSKVEDLVASAEAILRSKAQGYDRHHIDLLTPMGGATIVAKPTGHGWFEITRVI